MFLDLVHYTMHSFDIANSNSNTGNGNSNTNF